MKPGDLVVCIKDGFVWHHIDGKNYSVPGRALPVLRNVYTIREITHGHNGSVGLLFEEITNKPVKTSHDGIVEPSFGVGAFRRVVTPDISCFTEMLNKVDS